MWLIAWRIVTRQPNRLAFTVAGLGVLFLLSLVQVGLLVGWCLTTSAIILSAEADLWIMAPNTPAFDYGAPIPAQRIYQARNVPGIAWAEGMILKWAIWQRPDGRRISVEVVGLDRSLVGGPWSMHVGNLADLEVPDSVIVDAAYLPSLGVSSPGDEVDIYGHRATVRGISEGVRTFTASPFVFASLSSSRRYVHSMLDDEITFVLARCAEGVSPRAAARRVAQLVPHVEVLTRGQFARRTAAYWMLGTGAGITVVIVAILGFMVSALVVSQSLYSLTIDALPHYAVLKALGFASWKLGVIVVLQACLLGAGAMAVGGAVFLLARQQVAGTTVSLAMPSAVCVFLMHAFLLSCILASVVPVKTLRRLDPALVFKV